MKKLLFQFLVFAFLPLVMQAQNMGVGTTTPSEKLEVAGKIFTNEGGIKFPDQTVQTTAAFNLSLPPSAYAIPQGIGFISFDPTDLSGPVDTIGLEQVSLLYALNINVISSTGGNSDIDEVKILKQTDKASPIVFKYLLNQTLIGLCNIYLTQKNGAGDLVPYLQIRLEDLRFTQYNQTLQAGIGGGYAHTEEIKLNFTKITIKELDSGNCWCWNVQSNSSCGCF